MKKGNIKYTLLALATAFLLTTFIPVLTTFEAGAADAADVNGITYTYTGNAETYIAPTTGYYYIAAWGGNGGNGGNGTPYSATGKASVKASEYIYLEAGQSLTIYVGSKGGNASQNSPGAGGTNPDSNYNGKAGSKYYGGGAARPRLYYLVVYMEMVL